MGEMGVGEERSIHSYHNDRLGSTVRVTDSAGKIQAMANYDEWGTRTKVKKAEIAGMEFDLAASYTGHAWDGALRMYHAKARMYDPGNKRFMAEDLVKGEMFGRRATYSRPHTIDNVLYTLKHTGEYADLEVRAEILNNRGNSLDVGVPLKYTSMQDAINPYAYCGDNPAKYIDLTGLQREPGYYNGKYYADPDGAEFGKDSDTYKIINDLGLKWTAAEDQSQRAAIAELAEYTRESARGGTYFMYGNDKINDALSANAKEAEKVHDYWIQHAFDMENPGAFSLSGWLASNVAPNRKWDYKTVDEWRYAGDCFNGEQTSGTEDWNKGQVKHIYYEGEMISAGDLGNINYGYVGAALNLPAEYIYLSGGIVHQTTGAVRGEGLRPDYWKTYFDEPEDHELVKYGYELYSKR